MRFTTGAHSISIATASVSAKNLVMIHMIMREEIRMSAGLDVKVEGGNVMEIQKKVK